MSGPSKTIPKRGRRREGAGRPRITLRAMLEKLSPADADRLSRNIRRLAFQMLIDWARAELREPRQAK
jgi:hypothetical protein